MKVPLLEAVLPSNDQHLRRAIQKVMDLPAERLGVFGLAFKENTDDLRESPVVSLLEHLIGKGREVRVHDPHIRLEEIYGSNQRFVLAAIPHIANLLESSLEKMLEWVLLNFVRPFSEKESASSSCAAPSPPLPV